ncbi:MAG: hypothetical protein RLZZ403_71 [Pseudomonadota bacterium]|jgi:hypothetical protein
MANISQRGFRWVRSLYANAESNHPVARGRLASGYVPQIGASGTYNLRVGDPITRLSTGYMAAAIGSEGTHDLIVGVVCGFGPIYNTTTGRQEAVREFAGGGGVYVTAYQNMSWVYYIPVADQVFEVDADDGAAANDTEAEWIALVGQNADHVLTSGSTPDLNPLLDISSAATTAALQWNIIDYSPRIDNDLTVTRAKVQVVCQMIQAAGAPGTFQTAI